MKKALFILLSCLCLVGCSSQISVGVEPEIVSCKSIRVLNGNSSTSLYNFNSNSNYTRLYEYKNEAGLSIYLNSNTYDNINYYEDPFQYTSVSFSFDYFVGLLRVDFNLYLNTKDRIIKTETVYSEYTSKNLPPFVPNEGDNVAAYNCAKLGLYTEIDGGSIYKYNAETGLVRNKYYIISEQNNIEYYEK